MKRTPKTKANPLSPIALAAAVTVAAMAGACDEFSFVSLLTLPDQTELTLTVDRDSVPSGDSVALEVSGGTPPYTFKPLTGSDLYQPTKDRELGSIENSNFTAGEAIGKVLISVEDDAGVSASSTIVVLPPSPFFTQSSIRIGGGTTVQLYWFYSDVTMINGFRLEQSIDDSEYSFLQSYSANETATTFNQQPATSTLSFRLIALASDYESLPVTIIFQ